jgi:hypothetical protein
MAALALEHVAVWLDELAPEGGAFAHALDWAARLKLPLKAFAPDAAEEAAPREQPLACEAACARRGVRWESVRWQGPARAGVDRFLCPVALCAFGSTLPAALRHGLLHRPPQGPPAPVLVCPPAWQPLARLLVINQPGGRDGCFLDTVAHLCRAVAVAPVVLTVARSEREGQWRQQLAEERLAAHRLPADYDCVVGCDPAEAAVGVARWRRCSHVVVERPRAAPWWGWLRGDLPVRLLRRADALAVLVLPGAGLAAAREREGAVPALRWAWGLG